MGDDVPSNLIGLYKYIIGTLVFVVTVLAGANTWQWKEANSVNKARLTERDVLNKALTDVNATLATMNEASKTRNDVMDKLGDVIAQISVALKLLTERLELQHENTAKDLEDAIGVVSSMADALRNVSNEIKLGFAEMKSKI